MCRVHNDEDLMVVTDGGTIIRLPVHEISVYSRQAKGVRIITPAKKEQVVSIHPVVASDPEDELEHEEGELIEGDGPGTIEDGVEAAATHAGDESAETEATDEVVDGEEDTSADENAE